MTSNDKKLFDSLQLGYVHGPKIVDYRRKDHLAVTQHRRWGETTQELEIFHCHRHIPEKREEKHCKLFISNIETRQKFPYCTTTSILCISLRFLIAM